MLAACGGPGRATPTALPASLVRPMQPTPVYPVSVQEFTLAATATSTAEGPLQGGQGWAGGPAPALVASTPQVSLVMEQPPSALGIVADRSASVLKQPGGVPVANLLPGATLTVTGRSADGRYLAVYTMATGPGWVAADAIVLFGADDLTTVTAPADLGPVATLVAQAMEPVEEQVRRFSATPSHHPGP